MPGGDEGGFVGVEEKLALAVLHQRHAADHDPVLAAMVVHLQRQRSLGAHHDALDLEAAAFLEHGVGAPGPADRAVQAEGVVAATLEFLGDELDVLAARRVGHQQGVGGVDDDQVVHADGADQALRRIDVAVADVVQHAFAAYLVAVLVRRAEFAQRLPGADVAPADGAGHHGDLVRALHQRVVDGDVRRLGEGPGGQLALAALAVLQAAAVGQGGAGGDQHLRRVALQFLQHGGGLEAEHAGVPQVLAAVQVGLGGGLVGFLDEACDPEAIAQRGALFDIAEAGLGALRGDAEGHQVALGRESASLGHRRGEGLLVADQVVGGKDQQLRLVAEVLLHMQRGGGDGRRGIASHRLQQQVLGQAAAVDRAVVVQGAEQQVAVGHREQAGDVRQPGDTQEGLLQQALVIGQAHEGFRHALPGNRPQAGPGTAGNDAGDQRGDGVHQ